MDDSSDDGETDEPLPLHVAVSSRDSVCRVTEREPDDDTDADSERSLDHDAVPSFVSEKDALRCRDPREIVLDRVRVAENASDSVSDRSLVIECPDHDRDASRETDHVPLVAASDSDTDGETVELPDAVRSLVHVALDRDAEESLVAVSLTVFSFDQLSDALCVHVSRERVTDRERLVSADALAVEPSALHVSETESLTLSSGVALRLTLHSSESDSTVAVASSVGVAVLDHDGIEGVGSSVKLNDSSNEPPL